ncbi:MAG: hypothetical protein HRU31_02410 [Rhodobacteraceae bacterium]|nr:hypothetical protein [Paracoccaceae bacterium]
MAKLWQILLKHNQPEGEIQLFQIINSLTGQQISALFGAEVGQTTALTTRIGSRSFAFARWDRPEATAWWRVEIRAFCRPHPSRDHLPAFQKLRIQDRSTVRGKLHKRGQQTGAAYDHNEPNHRLSTPPSPQLRSLICVKFKANGSFAHQTGSLRQNP